MPTYEELVSGLFSKPKEKEPQIVYTGSGPNPFQNAAPTATPVAAPVPVQQTQTPAVQPLPFQQAPVQPVQTMAPPTSPMAPPVVKMAENVEGIDKASKQQLSASGQREQKIIDQQIQLQKDKSQAETAESQRLNELYGTKGGRAEEQMIQQAQIQDSIRAEMKDVDAQIEKLKSVEFKDFWADKSTGQKIAAALSVGLGAVGQGLIGGGQNVGMQMLTRAMDDDYKMQEANYNKALKQIELSRLNIDQKNKLIDNLEKQRLIYEAARSDAVLDAGVRMATAKNLGINPQAQEVISKLQLAKEASARDLIMKRADKIQQQYSVQQSPLAQKDWLEQASNEKSVLGQYNKAIDEYNKVQSFKKSGNYNASVINLIATGLQQGSYNPDNFDATTRSIAQKIKDKGLAAVGEGDKQLIVQAAEKFFAERAKEQLNAVKGIIPRAKQAELQGMGEGSIIRAFPQDLANQQKDLSQTGMKKL